MKKSIFLAGIFVLSLFHQTMAADMANPIFQDHSPEDRHASFGRLRTFFASYDTAILRAIFTRVVVENVSADPNIQYMINKNRELIAILSAINPVSYNQEQMNAADEMIVLAGLVELTSEPLEGGTAGKFSLDCLKSILGITGITTAVLEMYVTLATKQTAWATLRGFLGKSLKRYLGWAGVAFTVYDLIDNCF